MLNFISKEVRNLIERIGVKNYKTLASNLAALSTLQFLSYFFPLISIPYLTRIMTIEHYGYIALANISIVYFATIIDFGFAYSGTKKIAENRENNFILSKIISTIVTAKAFLSVISFVGLLLLIYTIDVFSKIKLLMLLFFFFNLTRIFSLDWFFQGMEKMKYITILNIFTRTIFLGLIFVFIKKDSDYIYYPVVLAIGFYTSEIIAWTLAIKKFHIKIIKPKLNDVFLSIKNSFDIFITQISHSLYNALSLAVMGIVCGPVANATYDAAYKFVQAIYNMLLSISRTFFPFLARNKDKHSIYAFIDITISAIVSITLCLIAKLLISIVYPNTFEESILVLRILAFLPLGFSFINVYGINFLVIHGYQSLMRKIVLSLSILGFFVATISAKYFGVIGVTCSIVFTSFACGISLMIASVYVKKQLKKST